MSYIIEKNIPLPLSMAQSMRILLANMDEEDSVLFSSISERDMFIKVCKKYGKTYASRKEDGKGWRVWIMYAKKT